MLDGFNHNNRVVHHNSDSDDQPKERKQINREAQYQHSNERTQQRDYNGKARYDRCPKIL